MRGFALTGFDTPPALQDDLPAPAPGDGEVLVRVRASSVNPVDAGIAGGMLRGMFEYEFPVLLGRDYVGVVEQAGSSVERYRVGDEVFGFVPHANPTVRDGSWAELIVLPQDNSVAPAPSGVDVAAAGAAPLAGITALTAVDALELSEGDTVLVVGATGGVGSFAVQLVRHAGATVVAPALPEDEDYLRGLGVTEIVPRDAGLGELRVDALLDLVSRTPDELDAYAAALKPGGRIASSVGAAGEGPGRTNVMAVASPENLGRLAGLLENGTLSVPIQQSFALEEAGEALEALAARHTQGKLAIRVDEPR